jgi:hypothetical protein
MIITNHCQVPTNSTQQAMRTRRSLGELCNFVIGDFHQVFFSQN